MLPPAPRHRNPGFVALSAFRLSSSNDTTLLCRALRRKKSRRHEFETPVIHASNPKKSSCTSWSVTRYKDGPVTCPPPDGDVDFTAYHGHHVPKMIVSPGKTTFSCLACRPRGVVQRRKLRRHFEDAHKGSKEVHFKALVAAVLGEEQPPAEVSNPNKRPFHGMACPICGAERSYVGKHMKSIHGMEAYQIELAKLRSAQMME